METKTVIRKPWRAPWKWRAAWLVGAVLLVAGASMLYQCCARCASVGGQEPARCREMASRLRFMRGRLACERKGLT